MVEASPDVGAVPPCHHVVMLLYVEPLAGSPDAAAAVLLIEMLAGMYAVEPLLTSMANVTD